MGEGLTNADVISTARPMSATAIETQDAGVSASPRAVNKLSSQAWSTNDCFLDMSYQELLLLLILLVIR
jgi:hypothetical protein